MANTKLPARLLDTSAVPALNVTGDLTVDTTTLKVDSSNNRVGIGTASPSASLHLSSANADHLYLERSGHDTFRIALSHSVGLGIYNVTDSRQDVMIDGSGRVGIGTTAPLTNLDVVRGGATGLSSVNARTTLLLQNNNSAGTVLSINAPNTGYSGIFLGDPENEAQGQIKQVHTDNSMQFVTQGGSAEMTLNNGKLGIGTSSPGAPLHIDHSSSTAYSGTAEILESVIIRNKDGTDNSGVNNVASLGFQVADGATSQGFLNYVRTGNNTGKFTLTQRTGSSSYHEPLTINQNGYVTLNHDAAEYGLQIRSTGTRSGLVIDKPGTTTIMGSALVLADESYRLGTASNYHIEMTQDGDTKINNHLLLTNDFGYRAYSGYFAAGTTTGNFDFNTYSAGCYEVTAAFGHYGFISSYGCFKKAICSNGSGYNASTSITVIDIATEITTGNGGSWTFAGFSSGSNQTSHIRVSKNAGTYAGGGYYFVEVRGNQGS